MSEHCCQQLDAALLIVFLLLVGIIGAWNVRLLASALVICLVGWLVLVLFAENHFVITAFPLLKPWVEAGGFHELKRTIIDGLAILALGFFFTVLYRIYLYRGTRSQYKWVDTDPID